MLLKLRHFCDELQCCLSAVLDYVLMPSNKPGLLSAVSSLLFGKNLRRVIRGKKPFTHFFFAHYIHFDKHTTSAAYVGTTCSLSGCPSLFLYLATRNSAS